MGRKRTPGLYKRKEVWHIDKQIRGIRITESTGSSDLEEAEKYLSLKVSEIRLGSIYGERPKHTFSEAAVRYLKENMNRKSISKDASIIKQLLPYIGNTALHTIHDGTMQAYIHDQQVKGLKSKTVNNGLEIVRRLLKKAATKWRDDLTSKTWIHAPAVIEYVNWNDHRMPYPISWEEQKYLVKELADHLVGPVLYALNTGCRDQEICQLKWEWEAKHPELNTNVFVLPEYIAKNNEERVVVLNSVAASVIESQRGKHPSRVFTYKDRPLASIYGHGWTGARRRAAKHYELDKKDEAHWGYHNLRVHDLRHTFGRRLRSAGVTKETRSALLGHKSGDITTHYSAAELQELLDAVGKITESNSRKTPTLTLLRASG